MGVKRDIDDLQNEIAKVQRDLSDLIDAQNKRIEALNTLFHFTRQDIKDLSAKIPKEPTGQDQ
jgi:hypothetical protein